MGISVAFVFLLLVLLFVAGVVGLIVVLVARRRRPKVDQASCGNCLYAVEGLTTMTCPECGSDLRKVGIVTPGRSPGAGPQLWVILWTLLLPLPALLVSRLVVVAWPVSYNTTRYITLRPAGSAAPFDAVKLELWSNDADQPGRFEWATLDLRQGGASAGDPLVLQLDTLRWTTGAVDRANLSDRQVTSTDVARWIADTTSAESEQPYIPTAVALLRIVQQGTAGPSISVYGEFSSVNLNSVQSQSRAGWLTPVLWIVWLVIWAGGVLMILHRARARSDDEQQPKTRFIDVSAE